MIFYFSLPILMSTTNNDNGVMTLPPAFFMNTLMTDERNVMIIKEHAIPTGSGADTLFYID